MQSQKFDAHFKCKCFNKKVCNCANKGPSSKLLLQNIDDIAKTLLEVMNICGIRQCKGKGACDVIKHSFLYYDEIRRRVDAVPRKRLCKEDLIHDLGRKCLMTRMEAQLTYAIIKRAFKAFYHGTCEGGIRNPILESQMIHSQECLWVHAAKRTAQIFASFAGMFYSSQQSYESKIKCIYKRLYDRLKQRAQPLDMQECSCTGCFKKAEHKAAVQKLIYPTWCIKQPQSEDLGLEMIMDNAPKSKPSDDVIKFMENKSKVLDVGDTYSRKKSSKESVHLPRCDKCKCPQLICDCDLKRHIITTECSQGPYKCFWMRMTEEEEEPPQASSYMPDNHHCPVDCDNHSDICDSECECNCSESCECAAEDNSSDYDYDGYLSEECDAYKEESIEYDPCAPLFTDKLSESEKSTLYEFADEPTGDYINVPKPREEVRISKSTPIDKITDKHIDSHSEGLNAKIKRDISNRESAAPLKSISNHDPREPSPSKSIANHSTKDQITNAPIVADNREQQEVLDLIGQLI